MKIRGNYLTGRSRNWLLLCALLAKFMKNTLRTIGKIEPMK